MLCYVMLCYVMLYYGMLCYVSFVCFRVKDETLFGVSVLVKLFTPSVHVHKAVTCSVIKQCLIHVRVAVGIHYLSKVNHV